MSVLSFFVVVLGQLAPGAQLEQVMVKVARLFNASAVGSELEEFTPPPAPEIDTSGLTTAPVGETLVEAPEVDPPAIDISRLTMALPGERLVDAPEVHAPDIDTSHLDMAPAGSDVGELRQTDFPPPPVTDHLTLE